MELYKVVGMLWLNRAEESIKGSKLLVLRPYDPKKNSLGKGYEIAVDTVDAGVGDIVFVCRGSAVRQTETTEKSSTDALIEAVVDSVDILNKPEKG